MPNATRIFMSYARRDSEGIVALVEGLRSYGADVWQDRALVGGHEWWETILAQIRQCDVFVQALSTSAIDSEACTRERAYAEALGKPILPVVVEELETSLLPVALSRLQLVRYIQPQSDDAFRLARALSSCPPAPPLPDLLPEPPDVPVSELHGLHERVRAPSLSLDEQLALIARLERALGRDGEHRGAMRLLRRLGERDDLLHVAAVRIDRLVGSWVDPDLADDASQPVAEKPRAVGARHSRGGSHPPQRLREDKPWLFLMLIGLIASGGCLAAYLQVAADPGPAGNGTTWLLAAATIFGATLVAFTYRWLKTRTGTDPHPELGELKPPKRS